MPNLDTEVAVVKNDVANIKTDVREIKGSVRHTETKIDELVSVVHGHEVKLAKDTSANEGVHKLVYGVLGGVGTVIMLLVVEFFK